MPRKRTDGPLAHAPITGDNRFFTPGGLLMRRVSALSSFVLVVTVVAGIAVAQDTDPTSDVPPEGPAPIGTTGEPTEVQPADEVATGEAVATTTAETMDAGTYAVRLRDLEQRINELKEQIFRSKARLSLLAETVLQGVVAGAQAVIVHENRMSSSFRLVKAVYALDGARIFSKADEEGALGERRELDIYDGSIVPGEHTLTVNLEYRGHGYGIFSYLKGYRFRVRSNYSFTAPEGKAITIRVVGYEKGGPTAPLEERPAIRFQERIQGTQRIQESQGGGAESTEGSGGE